MDPSPIPRQSIETLGQDLWAGIGRLDPSKIAQLGTSKGSGIEGGSEPDEQTARGCET